MKKSELISQIHQKNINLSINEVTDCINIIIETIKHSITKKQRVEIRNFGSFDINLIKDRQGRNPRTGEVISIEPKLYPKFKAGKYLRTKINNQ